jgi:hypothetical protein
MALRNEENSFGIETIRRIFISDEGDEESEEEEVKVSASFDGQFFILDLWENQIEGRRRREG